MGRKGKERKREGVMKGEKERERERKKEKKREREREGGERAKKSFFLEIYVHVMHCICTYMHKYSINFVHVHVCWKYNNYY